MRSMANLVSDICSLNTKDLELLAQGLAWYTTGTTNQAERFEFFLNAHIKEQKEKMDRFAKEVA